MKTWANLDLPATLSGMQQETHYREYPMGAAGRLVDALWVVVWPVMLGTVAGLLLLLVGLASIEQTSLYTDHVRSVSLRTAGWSTIAALALWLVGGLVSATRSLVYAHTLRRYHDDPSCRRTPPTPAQRTVARGGAKDSETKPFLVVWSFGLSFILAGIVPAVLGVVRLADDGAGLLLVGGAAGVVVGAALILLARFTRRRVVALRVAWGNRPSRNPSRTGARTSRPVDLPDRYRTIGVAHRWTKNVGYAAVASLFLAIALMGKDPDDAGSRAIISEPGVIGVSWFSGSFILALLCLAVAIALDCAQHSILLSTLEREAVKDEEFGTMTQPKDKILSEALTGGGPVRRAVQLLSAISAALLVVALPTVAVIEEATGAGRGGGTVLVSVGSGVILVAFVTELLTSTRDRERRNRLLRIWPSAL